eukprot:6176094-Pleurochrysis_carterae.AAC.2
MMSSRAQLRAQLRATSCSERSACGLRTHPIPQPWRRPQPLCRCGLVSENVAQRIECGWRAGRGAEASHPRCERKRLRVLISRCNILSP